MADNRTRGGLRWKRSKDGGRNCPIEIWPVADDYATDIFKGDPVKIASDGTVAVAAGGDTNIYGVCDGVEQVYDATLSVVKKASFYDATVSYDTNAERQTKIRVIPCANQVFEIDADDAVTATTYLGYQAFVYENCDHIVGSGSTTSGISAAVLDISGHGTGTANWRIIGVSDTLENQDYSGNRVKLLVVVNETSTPDTSTTGT